jgi:hypothetical protein
LDSSTVGELLPEVASLGLGARERERATVGAARLGATAEALKELSTRPDV